jgi:hypothetical protein
MELKPIAKQAKERVVGYGKLEREPPFVSGYKGIGGRSVPLVATRLSACDRLGALAMRWDIGRDRYKVEPGLYAVGDPGPGSPVLVGANYKLSFDRLRAELGGLDAWLLVLDTKGINVWCAAGKGTFGTAELLDKLARTRLKDIVSHNVIVLPQLAAPGVGAPEVARVAGFRVAWGPVRSSDVPAYLAAGMVKTDEMHRVRFGLAERMAVAPVELVQAWPFLLGSVALSALGALPAAPGYGRRLGWLLVATVGSVLAGALAFPALLPLLPTKAYSIKGAALGAIVAGAAAVGALGPSGGGLGAAMGAALVLACAPLVSYIGLNFTGASTFTCQTGATLEVERSIVPIIVTAALGIALGAASRIFGF